MYLLNYNLKGHVILQPIPTVLGSRTALFPGKRDAVTREITKKDVNGVAAKIDTVKGIDLGTDTGIEIMRGTRTDAGKETENVVIAATGLVLEVTAGIATVIVTVRGVVIEKIEGVNETTRRILVTCEIMKAVLRGRRQMMISMTLSRLPHPAYPRLRLEIALDLLEETVIRMETSHQEFLSIQETNLMTHPGTGEIGNMDELTHGLRQTPMMTL